MLITTARGRIVDVHQDYTRKDGWATFTPDEHDRWDFLFNRQLEILKPRACDEFLGGMEALNLTRKGIPDFDELNARLHSLTGWQVVPVPDLVPDRIFFEHLARRELCIGNFIRGADQIDYIMEPDIFHDLFGHVPTLADPVYADYVQAFGKAGCAADDAGEIERMARLYWYTVEFGMIATAEGPKVYGAGIASSPGESRFSVDSPSPHRLSFDIDRIIRTSYRVDDFQLCYFVNSDFDELRQATCADLSPQYEALKGQPDYHPGALHDGDEVIFQGTQDYARSKSQLAETG